MIRHRLMRHSVKMDKQMREEASLKRQQKSKEVLKSMPEPTTWEALVAQKTESLVPDHKENIGRNTVENSKSPGVIHGNSDVKERRDPKEDDVTWFVHFVQAWASEADILSATVRYVLAPSNPPTSSVKCRLASTYFTETAAKTGYRRL